MTKKTAATMRRAFGSILQLPGRSGFYVRVPATDEDGRAIMREGPNGKPYQVRRTQLAGDTRAAAEKLLAKLAGAASATKQDGSAATLSRFAEDVFLPELSALRSPGHVANVAAQIDAAARYFGDESMRSVTTGDAQHYVTHLATRGLSESRAEARRQFALTIAERHAKKAADDKDAKAAKVAQNAKDAAEKKVAEDDDSPAAGLSPAAVHRHVSALSLAWKCAAKHGHDFPNVWRGLALPKVEQTERPYLAPQDVQRLLAVLPDSTRPVFVLLFNLGARLSEILNLDWSQVSVETGFNRVTFTKTAIGRTKSGKSREVVCLPDAVAALRELHEKRAPAPISGPYRVFPEMDRKTPLRHIKAAAERLKLPELRNHDARHFYATAAIRAGVPPTDVARLLGHSDARLVLQRYGHHAPANYADAAAARMASALGQVPPEVRKKSKPA
jgi:integrase